MKVLVSNILGPLVTGLMAVIVANCNEGCKEAESPKSDGGTSQLGAEYAAELMTCVAVSPTKQDEELCRTRVNMNPKYKLCKTEGWPPYLTCKSPEGSGPQSGTKDGGK